MKQGKKKKKKVFGTYFAARCYRGIEAAHILNSKSGHTKLCSPRPLSISASLRQSSRALNCAYELVCFPYKLVVIVSLLHAILAYKSFLGNTVLSDSEGNLYYLSIF